MKELLKAKSEFRKQGVTLIADKVKSGGGGSWKFAGEDNLISTVQEPLTKCGLELIITMEYLDSGVNAVCATLYHVNSGENISSRIALPAIKPRSDKNNNPMYLDAEIERGKQFGYWSRVLAIRILGISDIDAEDVNNYPQNIENKNEDFEKLENLIMQSSNKSHLLEWVHKTYAVTDINQLNATQVKTIVISLESKKAKNDSSK